VDRKAHIGFPDCEAPLANPLVKRSEYLGGTSGRTKSESEQAFDLLSEASMTAGGQLGGKGARSYRFGRAG
jgi:hypothetical protein